MPSLQCYLLAAARLARLHITSAIVESYESVHLFTLSGADSGQRGP